MCLAAQRVVGQHHAECGAVVTLTSKHQLVQSARGIPFAVDTDRLAVDPGEAWDCSQKSRTLQSRGSSRPC